MITTVIIAALALGVSAVALAFAIVARNDSTAVRGELRRHRYSHTLQAEEPGARRHSAAPGPPPVADRDAAPPTEDMRAVQPEGVGAMRPPRRRVRDDPQA